MVNLVDVYEGQKEHLKNQIAIIEFDLNFDCCADKEFYEHLLPKLKKSLKRIIGQIKAERLKQ